MHTDALPQTLAGVIRDAFFDARNKGETMYQASDVAAAHVLAVLSPSMLRLQHEMDQLLLKWEEDRKTIPSGDWQAGVADAVLKLCIQELRTAVKQATTPVELRLVEG
jgi:hypothetical protein